MGNFLVTAEAGGSASSSTAPLAPAITSSWISGLTPVYLQYGNAWKVSAVQGTLTPPVGTDVSHLRQVRIALTDPNGVKSEDGMWGPFVAGTGGSFIIGTDYLLTTGGTFTIAFTSENDDSKLTTPYSTTVVVNAPAVTAVSASEGTRYKNASGGLNTQLQFSATVSNGLYPLTVTAWRNEGGTVKWCGWYVIPSAGATVQIGAPGTNGEGTIFPPIGADQTWNIKVAVGTYGTNEAPPGTAATSNNFTVAAPGLMSATVSSAATTTTPTYSGGPGGASNYTFTVRFKLPLTDPNFFYGRLYRQTGKYVSGVWTPGGAGATKVAIGDWAGPCVGYEVEDHAACFALETTITDGWIIATLGPEWGTVTSDGNNIIKLTLGVASRKDTSGTGGTETLQTTWPGGLSYYDVVLDPTKSQTDARLINPSTLDPSLVLDATTGKPRINTRNLSNLLFNGGFDDSLYPWDKLLGTEIGYFSSAGFALSGSGFFTDSMTSYGGIKQSGVSCRAGDEFYVECYLNAGFGTVSGSAFLSLNFLNSSGVSVGNPYTALALSSGMGWTKLSLSGTAPAGASTVSVAVQIGPASGTGFWYIDNVLLTRPEPIGDGLERNASGGPKWKPGAGHRIGSDGSAEVYTGPGATINGSGQVVPNLAAGSSVGLNAFNQLVVPSGSLGNANFGSGLEAYGIYFGAPTGVGYSTAPNVIIDTSTTPWKVKRKNGSGGWTVATDPADIVAGTITALVAIQSPSISGGTLAGAQITSTLNGVTCEMNGSYDTQVGGYTGLKVRDSTWRVVVVPGGVWMLDSNNYVRTQIFSDGTAKFYDSTGHLKVSIDGANGQVMLFDSSGVARAIMDSLGGAGHISVSGTGASITINGRSL